MPICLTFLFLDLVTLTVAAVMQNMGCLNENIYIPTIPIFSNEVIF